MNVALRTPINERRRDMRSWLKLAVLRSGQCCFDRSKSEYWDISVFLCRRHAPNSGYGAGNSKKPYQRQRRDVAMLFLLHENPPILRQTGECGRHYEFFLPKPYTREPNFFFFFF